MKPNIALIICVLFLNTLFQSELTPEELNTQKVNVELAIPNDSFKRSVVVNLGKDQILEINDKAQMKNLRKNRRLNSMKKKKDQFDRGIPRKLDKNQKVDDKNLNNQKKRKI